MDDRLDILGIAGSLREGSYNAALITAAAELAPASMRVTAHALDDVPMFRPELDAARPAPVVALREAIAQADGVLIATPEYNYGVPGVLKNALDWASRPAYRSPFRDKPVAILGASGGAIGAARGQAALRVVLAGMASALLPWPELAVGRAAERIVDGRLVDEDSRARLADMLGAFDAWTRAVAGYRAARVR